MLSDGKVYSHKCVRLPCSFSILSCPHRFGKISTDRSTAGCKLNAHFRRLGFKSSKQPPLQIGAQIVLHNLEVSEMNGAFGVVHEAPDSGQRLLVKILGPQRILELLSPSQDGAKRFSGCLLVRPENCTERTPKYQNILFLNPDLMLNPFGGDIDSIYFESGDDYDHVHSCLYNSDLENDSSDDDD